MAAFSFVLLCLTSFFITSECLEGPHEISKITLQIWGDDYCGSNYGPYIEIQSRNGERRNTYFHGPFSKGTTLIWDNKGENRYGGRNLGGVSGWQVEPLYFPYGEWTPFNPLTHYGMKFRIVGGGGDDFCPHTLKIYTKDGKEYGRYYMEDWVDNKKGGGWRLALQKRCTRRTC